MTPFGNRDFERTHAPGADEDSFPETSPESPEPSRWERDESISRLLDRTSPTPTEVTRDTRRVVVRMHGGEDLELGRVEGRDPAVQMARDMVRAIENAESLGEWPLIGDRFVRPGAIVSIDVQRAS
jgi:hypothetical protein